MGQTIGYSRVSTDEQAREGVSIDMQARKIAAYAEVKDWTVDEVITDAGYSAKSLARPGMQRLIAMVEAGQVSTVIAHKLDRLTRSVADLDKLVKLFERKDVALVSLQESLDATTATGRLMMNLLASVSQWEREIIGERTRDALQELKEQGKVYSRPVFDNATLLSRMREERAAGASYDAIARQLNNAGVVGVRGGVWTATTVRRILRHGGVTNAQGGSRAA
jgi:site-specific DNA recombinase